MGRTKWGVITLEVRRLPPCRRKKSMRLRQYEDGKRRLSHLAATCAEYEFLCKTLTAKYKI
mgnify:FL=1